MYNLSNHQAFSISSTSMAAIMHSPNSSHSFPTAREHGQRLDKIINNLNSRTKHNSSGTVSHYDHEKDTIDERTISSSERKPKKTFRGSFDEYDKQIIYNLLVAGLEQTDRRFSHKFRDFEQNLSNALNNKPGKSKVLNRQVLDLVKELSYESNLFFSRSDDHKFNVLSLFFRYHRLFKDMPGVSRTIVDEYMPLLAERRGYMPDDPKWAENRSLVALNSQDFDTFGRYLSLYSRCFNELIVPYLKRSKRLRFQITPQEISDLKNSLNRKMGLVAQEKPRRTYRNVLLREYASSKPIPKGNSLSEKLSKEKDCLINHSNTIKGYFHLNRELRKISEGIKKILERYDIDPRKAFGFDIYFIKETKLIPIKTLQEQGYFKRIRK